MHHLAAVCTRPEVEVYLGNLQKILLAMLLDEIIQRCDTKRVQDTPPEIDHLQPVSG